MIYENNVIFITTPDDIISKIDKDISEFNLEEKYLCHCSGSLSSDVLYNAKCAGAQVYSIHPMYAFSSRNIPVEDLKNIYFSIEGDMQLLNDSDSVILRLMKKLKNKYFIRNAMLSAEYHVSNVMVSNLILSLLNIGVKYMIKCGLNEKEALDALKPLIMNNIESIMNKGFKNSLTGPVVRNDVNTIKKHKKVLEPEDKALYNALSLNLLNIMCENSSEDYNKYAEIISALKE